MQVVLHVAKRLNVLVMKCYSLSYVKRQHSHYSWRCVCFKEVSNFQFDAVLVSALCLGNYFVKNFIEASIQVAA